MTLLVEAESNMHNYENCECGCYDHCSCDTESCMCDGQVHE